MAASTPPKHIALITPGIADGAEDSTCIPALYDYVRALKQHLPTTHISIFTLHYPQQRPPYQFYGCTVYPLHLPAKRWWLAPWLLRQAIHRTCIALAADTSPHEPPDVIHAFWLGKTTLLAMLLARKLTTTGKKIPVITTLMGQDAQPSRFYRYLLTKCRYTVAVSPWQHTFFQRACPGQRLSHVIPWGIAPSTIITATALAAPPEKDIDILAVGNVIPLKDPLGFIEIVRMLLPTHPNLRAQWIGKGVLLSQCQARVKELGLDAHITFTGTQSRQATLTAMTRSKVLLHTSHYESFGMVIIEARACGARVVARPVGIANGWQQDGLTCANDNNMLAQHVAAALAQSPLPPSCPFPLSDSVNAYLHLYAACL
jgi:glycosyltransferase involved in cell wall biosynthesis